MASKLNRRGPRPCDDVNGICMIIVCGRGLRLGIANMAASPSIRKPSRDLFGVQSGLLLQKVYIVRARIRSVHVCAEPGFQNADRISAEASALLWRYDRYDRRPS